MKNAIEAAITELTNKAKDAAKSEDALRFTQAALNLAHVEAVADQIKRANATGGST